MKSRLAKQKHEKTWRKNYEKHCFACDCLQYEKISTSQFCDFLQMFVSFPTFYKSLKKFSFLSVSSFFIVSKNGKKSINVLLKLLFIIVYMFFLNTMLISKQNGLEVCTKNTFFCVLPLLAISLWVTRNIFLNIEFWWNFEANCQIL